MTGSILEASYCQAGEFGGPLVFNLVVSTIIYLLIRKTNNWSWMDRLWGPLPIVYAVHFLLYPHYCLSEDSNPRKQMMAALVILWGLRLTHTLYRKGVYSKGCQDPRLTQIKNTSSPLKKQLFVIFFICLYQPMLSLWLTSPISHITDHQINPQDLILFTFGIQILILQGIADQQQYNYQKEKKKYANLKDENIPKIYKIGFVTTGLWGYSRHPNYFAEVIFWWVLYLYSFFDYGESFAVIGVLQYSIFFITSIRSGEKLMLRKYPLYKLYQQNVCAFMPLPSRFHAVLEQQPDN